MQSYDEKALLRFHIIIGYFQFFHKSFLWQGKNNYICIMSNEESLNFVFSEDVKLLETADLEDYCLHLLCKEGEGSFVYNDRCFYLQRNSLVVIAHPRKASN